MTTLADLVTFSPGMDGLIQATISFRDADGKPAQIFASGVDRAVAVKNLVKWLIDLKLIEAPEEPEPEPSKRTTLE